MPSMVVRRVLVLLGTAALLAVSAACTTDDAPAVRAADVVGSWGTSTTMGQAYLVLEEDGTAHGSDGCNRLDATWQAGGKGVSFSAWAGAEGACPQDDAWLSSTVGGRLEDGDLLLVDQDNLNLGRLQSTH